jgi:hypothetical protein
MTTHQGSKVSRRKEISATDHQEIEWQFDAGDLESVGGWLDQHTSGSSGLVVAPESTVEITDTYYDTDDWRFYRAGYALRVRNTDGEVEATMKSLTPAEGSLRRRREISEPLSDDKPATLREAGVAFTMGVYAERCTLQAKDLRSVVPGSNPFRTLAKGKEWKTFEKDMESRGEANTPNEDTR